MYSKRIKWQSCFRLQYIHIYIYIIIPIFKYTICFNTSVLFLFKNWYIASNLFIFTEMTLNLIKRFKMTFQKYKSHLKHQITFPTIHLLFQLSIFKKQKRHASKSAFPRICMARVEANYFNTVFTIDSLNCFQTLYIVTYRFYIYIYIHIQLYIYSYIQLYIQL